MPEIQMDTTVTGEFCHAAKILLDREGLAFEQINVTTDPEARDALAKRTGRTTVPQIFVDGRAIGGFEHGPGAPARLGRNDPARGRLTMVKRVHHHVLPLTPTSCTARAGVIPHTQSDAARKPAMTRRLSTAPRTTLHAHTAPRVLPWLLKS